MTVGGEGEAEGRGVKGWGEKKRERSRWEGGEKRERLGSLPIFSGNYHVCTKSSTNSVD